MTPDELHAALTNGVHNGDPITYRAAIVEAFRAAHARIDALPKYAGDEPPPTTTGVLPLSGYMIEPPTTAGTAEPLYPCTRCGKLRTKAQGGAAFTVCDACWDKAHAEPPSPEAAPMRAHEALDDAISAANEWLSNVDTDDEDVRDLVRDLVDAAHWARMTIDATKRKAEPLPAEAATCPQCGGDGWRMDQQRPYPYACKACNGTGYPLVRNPADQMLLCSQCGGTGKRPAECETVEKIDEEDLRGTIANMERRHLALQKVRAQEWVDAQELRATVAKLTEELAAERRRTEAYETLEQRLAKLLEGSPEAVAPASLLLRVESYVAKLTEELAGTRAECERLQRVAQGRLETFKSAVDVQKKMQEQLDAARRELAEWAEKDGNSPGYNRQKAETYGRKAAEYKKSAEAAEARLRAAWTELQSTRWNPKGSITEWAATREGQNHGAVMRALDALRELDGQPKKAGS